ncbi:hypothetical protein JX266_014142 [Neoarthrinium moseri]|nr:hypothetical protein JX266_014142 [Neoarthrinium moseri]
MICFKPCNHSWKNWPDAAKSASELPENLWADTHPLREDTTTYDNTGTSTNLPKHQRTFSQDSIDPLASADQPAPEAMRTRTTNFQRTFSNESLDPLSSQDYSAAVADAYGDGYASTAYEDYSASVTDPYRDSYASPAYDGDSAAAAYPYPSSSYATQPSNFFGAVAESSHQAEESLSDDFSNLNIGESTTGQSTAEGTKKPKPDHPREWRLDLDDETVWDPKKKKWRKVFQNSKGQWYYKARDGKREYFK